jgi:aspartate kinase
MAAALGAEYCEICSDVDGVYTADPRVVPDARRIGTMSYEETQELAESGAKVLNAQAVEFAKEKGIAIYARATAAPLPGADPSSDGTVVRRDTPARLSASRASATSLSSSPIAIRSPAASSPAPADCSRFSMRSALRESSCTARGAG